MSGLNEILERKDVQHHIKQKEVELNAFLRKKYLGRINLFQLFHAQNLLFHKFAMDKVQQRYTISSSLFRIVASMVLVAGTRGDNLCPRHPILKYNNIQKSSFMSRSNDLKSYGYIRRVKKGSLKRKQKVGMLPHEIVYEVTELGYEMVNYYNWCLGNAVNDFEKEVGLLPHFAEFKKDQ